MPKPKVLISTSTFGECGRQPLDLLEQAGFEHRLNPLRRRLNGEEVQRYAADCVGIIAGVESLDGLLLSRLKGIRCISRCGAGLDNVDLAAAKALGIEVRNTPDGPTRAVAELALGLMFSLARRIAASDRAMRAGVWAKEAGVLLQGKVVGVVGLGRIGKAVAELAQAAGCRILAFDVRPDLAWAVAHDVELAAFDDLLRRSDFICLHVSMDRGQGPIIGERELALLRSEAYLLNLSRGGAVDEQALSRCLKARAIAGAALDVFIKEPYQGELLALDNVVLTPHLGSYAREAKLAMEIESVRNLLNVLAVESAGVPRSDF